MHGEAPVTAEALHPAEMLSPITQIFSGSGEASFAAVRGREASCDRGMKPVQGAE